MSKFRPILLVIGFAVIGCLVSVLFWLLSQYRHTIVLGPEPSFEGRPLHEWAMETESESIDFSPSPEARKAAHAVRAIGPAAVPLLIK